MNNLNISVKRTHSVWSKIPNVGNYEAYAKVFGTLVTLGSEKKTYLLGREKEFEVPSVRNVESFFIVHIFGNETIELTDPDTFEVTQKTGYLYEAGNEQKGEK